MHEKRTPKRLFLLGGSDLEMRTIRELLEARGCVEYSEAGIGRCAFVDKGLSWGASVEDYKEIIEKHAGSDVEIYGIELSESDKVKLPSNYHAIDHHNENRCRPSALEQVAELLGVELDPYQRLVAANDRGYIPAMEALGANEAEIEKIRLLDRRAQGVTEDEERQAEKEIEKAEKEGDVWVLKTNFKHFSPLMDRLYMQGKRELLIYNDRQLSYSGRNVDLLIIEFDTAIRNGMAYYGGSPLGYFGLTESYLSHRNVERVVEKILSLINAKKDQMKSYHIFMFPFVVKTDQEEENKERIKEKNEKSEDEENKVFWPKEDSSWQKVPFAIEGDEGAFRYNEYTYFHPYVRKVLFNDEEDQNLISRYYEYSKQEGEYIIDVKGKSYRLKLDGIALRHFKNDVGILSFHLINDRYENFEDILNINDFGRRLFPQFLGDGSLVEATKNQLLPCRLGLRLRKEDEETYDEYMESFEYYASLKNVAEKPHRLPCFIKAMLEEAYGKNYEDKVEPILDDRMYTLCHLMDDTLSRRLKKSYENDGDWYRYIFVDGGDLTCQNEKMLRDLIAKSTYDRWSGYGTLFGITRYSLMLLTADDWFGRNFLNRHMRTIYYQMATLLLAYRAMILNFSDRVTEAKKDEEAEKKKKKKKKIRDLFDDYLEFENRIYFKEVTAQEQGIEMFDMARKWMRLDTHLADLDHDIEQLHDYAAMKNEEQRNDRLELISKLGAIFLPPSLMAGLYGMNIINFDDQNLAWKLLVIVLMVMSAILGWYIVEKEDKKGKKFWWNALLFAIIFIPVILFPTTSPHKKETPPKTKEATTLHHPTTKEHHEP
jgi:hypothetical protein